MSRVTLNIFPVAEFPSYVLVIETPGIDIKTAHTLFKSHVVFACRGGKTYFLGDSEQLLEDKQITKLEWSDVQHDIKRELCNSCIYTKMKSKGLISCRGRRFYASKTQSLSGLNPTSIGTNLYMNSSIEYSFEFIDSTERFVLLPNKVVTSNGDAWDRNFERAHHFDLIKYQSYPNFVADWNAWLAYLGESISYDAGTCGRLIINLTPEYVEDTKTLNEPSVSFHFGTDKENPWPYYGLKKYHPHDFNTNPTKKTINVALIGTGMSFGLLREIKDGNSDFPGFTNVFQAEMIMGEDRVSKLDTQDLRQCKTIEDVKTLYLQGFQVLKDKNAQYDVLIVELPGELEHLFTGQGVDLRDYLKVIFIGQSETTQIITRKAVESRDRYKFADLALGLYVSAGGKPWMLPNLPLSTCFIGVSFGIKKTAEGSEILVGIAEIFDNYGESLSIRSTSAVYSRSKGYHLTGEALEGLVRLLVEDYRQQLGDLPVNIVVHKSSDFDEEEKEVVEKVRDLPININLLYVDAACSVRLIPNVGGMPYRGLLWLINEETSIIYTSGIVASARTYLEVGYPRPLSIKKYSGNFSIEELSSQVLSLTKLNWNSTKNHERLPVTLSHSRKVIDLLNAGLDPSTVVKDFRFYI